MRNAGLQNPFSSSKAITCYCHKDRAPRAQEALPVSSLEIFPLMAVKCVSERMEKYLGPEL